MEVSRLWWRPKWTRFTQPSRLRKEDDISCNSGWRFLFRDGMKLFSRDGRGGCCMKRGRSLLRISKGLTAVCNEFRPFYSARAVLTVHTKAVFKGIFGSYGKIRGAPMFIVFIGDERDPHVNERVGYTGEGIVLEAAADNASSMFE
jgi:hypothetical protein